MSTESKAIVPFNHWLLALAVVLVWGTNFVVIKGVLAHVPPFAFATLRFALAAFPALLFVKRPAPWANLAMYGVLIGVGQFGTLFYAMQRDISPGLVSLLIQTQVFFTIGLSMLILGERVRLYQGVALLFAAAGVVVIAQHTDATSTPLGIVLILGAALSWGAANLVSKRAGRVDTLAYMVWSSAFAVPPLAALAWVHDGPAALHAAWQHFTAWDALGVIWQSAGNTLFGYGAWAWLLSRHPAASIVPSALLVPVVGMTTAAVIVAEPMPGWKLLATALVIGGLALNVAWPRWREQWLARKAQRTV